MEVDIISMPHQHPQLIVYSNYPASYVDQIIMQAEYQYMNYMIDKKTISKYKSLHYWQADQDTPGIGLLDMERHHN